MSSVRIYKTKKELERTRLSKGHDKSGTRGRRKIYYTVHCELHGVRSKSDIEKVVIVGEPTSRRKSLTMGCPICHSLKIVKEIA